MKNGDAVRRLIKKIRDVVNEVAAANLGVAFSGGVDSSLLTKVCKDSSRRVTLLTVGFSESADIDTSRQVSRSLGLDLVCDVVAIEELEQGLKTVLGMVEVDRITGLENCASYYYVFRLASRHALETVLSANGLDELFCGYDMFRRSYGDEQAVIGLMQASVETARRDRQEIEKLSALFGIEYACPFLSDSFVDFAMEIPLSLKIKGPRDYIRKHVVREAAIALGVPESTALRAKKAFQYSSGLHKSIMKLARTRGFTRENAKKEGFHGEIEAYIQSLKE